MIKLTVAEQAFQLSLQEQSVPQIANKLSLTVAAVKNYLGITNSTWSNPLHLQNQTNKVS